MKNRLRQIIPGLAAAIAILGFSVPADAHRAWMLPSATVLSGNESWVTVDAAVSNDLFYFEHFPMRLDGIVAFAPDGSAVKLENASTGRYRSTFDVHLTQQGTYKIANVNDGLFASYKVDGKPKRFRGDAAALAKEVPANAQELKVSEVQSRNEVFVTLGNPTDTVLKPSGKGLELAPVTHPDDMVVGEPATLGFLLDGKPAANVKVTIVPGGIRYRNQLNQMDLTTDAKGQISVNWPTPGMYWLEAQVRDDKTSVPQAKERRSTYIAVLEIMGQ